MRISIILKVHYHIIIVHYTLLFQLHVKLKKIKIIKKASKKAQIFCMKFDINFLQDIWPFF